MLSSVGALRKLKHEKRRASRAKEARQEKQEQTTASGQKSEPQDMVRPVEANDQDYQES